MLIPSYAELMNVLNKESCENEQITSRYTIVIAAAKRARQIINGDEPMVECKKGKPLSTAVEEIYKEKIKVVPEGEGTIIDFSKNLYEDVENLKPSTSEQITEVENAISAGSNSFKDDEFNQVQKINIFETNLD